MPIWEPSLIAAGLTPADVSTAIHTICRPELGPFLLHLGPLADIIPIPFPLDPERRLDRRRLPDAPGSPCSCSPASSASRSDLDDEEAAPRRSHGSRLGGDQPGGSRPVAGVRRSRRPSSGRSSWAAGAAAARLAPAMSDDPGRTGPRVAERIRRHPYVRLALNGSFSALWVGQLISLFGDRIHQFALAALVLGDDRLDRRRRPLVFFARPPEPVPLARRRARSWTAGTARRC